MADVARQNDLRFVRLGWLARAALVFGGWSYFNRLSLRWWSGRNREGAQELGEESDRLRIALERADDELADGKATHGVVADGETTDGAIADRQTSEREASDRETSERQEPQRAAAERNATDGKSAKCDYAAGNAAQREKTGSHIAERDHTARVATNFVVGGIRPDGDGDQRVLENGCGRPPANRLGRCGQHGFQVPFFFSPLTRSRYLPVLRSTRTSSPGPMNNGTWILTPFSSCASFQALS